MFDALASLVLLYLGRATGYTLSAIALLPAVVVAQLDSGPTVYVLPPGVTVFGVKLEASPPGG